MDKTFDYWQATSLQIDAKVGYEMWETGLEVGGVP